MNYIGSKHRLVGFIKKTIAEVVSEELPEMVFCDLFAGTGVVGRSFKPHVKKIIANDVEIYSYALLKNYIGNHTKMDYLPYLEALNGAIGVKGFVFEHYSQGGKAERLYFSSENGMKIDAARQQLKIWKSSGEIDKNLYYFLLASLLESADKVANTASVYSAYLKKVKATAERHLMIEPAFFEVTPAPHQVFNQDSNELIKKIEGDVLYLDPPYNARQYGSNYHILNTIAKYDTFMPKGKTGVRKYFKSAYCKKNLVKDSFEELIKNAKFKYVFFSYNNEGIMQEKEIKNIMEAYGRYGLVTKKYKRFKADKTVSRNHKAVNTTEFLHILEK